MKIAVVATQDPSRTAARLSAARSRGEVVLVAPADLAAQLPPLAQKAIWAAADSSDHRAPGTRDTAANPAFEALRTSGVPFDEVRFEASTGVGAVACAEARTGGLRVGARLVIELVETDASLPAPPALGDRVEDRLIVAAARAALRDCDAVEGDAETRAALLAAGWELAAPPSAPAWPESAAPDVTAIVTYFNLGPWLPACLASLRAQTVPVEILVIDDGSTGEHAEVLAREQAADPSLRVISQRNQGLNAARNRGIAESRSQLLLMVDADNIMRPRLVERLREALRQRPDASWACPAFRSFEDGSGQTVFHYGPAEQCEDLMLLRNVTGDACALFRRAALEQLGGYTPELADISDWHLWLRGMAAGLTGVAVPEVLFDYRERRDSMLRSLTPIRTAAYRTELLWHHRGLLARHAQSVACLAASELVSEAEHNRWLGKRDREAEVAALRAREAEVAGQLGELRAYADQLAADLSGSQGYVRKLEAELGALRGYTASVERQLAGAASAAADQAAELEELRKSELLAKVRVLEVTQEAHGATLAREEVERSLAETTAALEEMSRSSAVRAARLLHEASPGAQKVAAQLARTLLGMIRGR